MPENRYQFPVTGGMTLATDFRCRFNVQASITAKVCIIYNTI